MGEPRKLERDDFVRMNLPSDFWPASSDKIPRGAYPSIHNYGTQIGSMLHDGLGFFLVGPAGVGKTGIAAVLAKIAKCYGHSVFFVTISDLREMIRSHIVFDDRSMLERCKEVELLILDNLREEDAKDSVVNAASLEALIEQRVAWKRSTVITSRMSPAVVPKVYPGIFEVLKARSPFLPVEGENLRNKAADEVKARLLINKKDGGA
jgi:DNA replication protein DnaC